MAFVLCNSHSGHGPYGDADLHGKCCRYEAEVFYDQPQAPGAVVMVSNSHGLEAGSHVQVAGAEVVGTEDLVTQQVGGKRQLLTSHTWQSLLMQLATYAMSLQPQTIITRCCVRHTWPVSIQTACCCISKLVLVVRSGEAARGTNLATLLLLNLGHHLLLLRLQQYCAHVE